MKNELEIRGIILGLFSEIKSMAERTTCKRKGVGCAILEINEYDDEHQISYAINGHSGDGTGNVCQNIVGGCGCAHSEPRAIMNVLKYGQFIHCTQPARCRKRILLSTYSACVNCANIIIDSGIIDAVAYEIHAEYWDEPPRNASKIIRSKIPLWTMMQIIDDICGEKTIGQIL